MRLRFLQMVASSNPDYPFRAGQIIEIPSLTDAFAWALAHHMAEILPDVPEAAVDETPVERAVLPRAKGRRRRDR